MWVISLRRRVALFAIWASVLLLSLGDVVAWTPSRPAGSPKTVVTESNHIKWASAGFLAASLAFVPLTAYADEATVNEPPPTAVKVIIESNSLIRSTEDNGQLNKEISSFVKNSPSNSIKLDTPKEEAQALREASKEESAVSKQEVSPSDAAEEVTVNQKEKTTAETAEKKVNEEPKAQVVEQGKEKVIEEPKAQVVEQVKEKVIEEPKAQVVEQVEETVMDEPKAQVVKQVARSPTDAVTDATAATKAEEKKTTEEAQVVQKTEETTAEQIEVKVIEKPKAQVVEQVDKSPTKAATDATAATDADAKKSGERAQVVQKMKETTAEQVEEKVIEKPKAQVVEQVQKNPTEAVKDASAATDAVEKKSMEEAQVVQKAAMTPEEALMDRMTMDKKSINTMSTEVASFWDSPSGYSVTLPTPVGQEGRTYVLSKLDVIGGSLLGLGASYLLVYLSFMLFSKRAI